MADLEKLIIDLKASVETQMANLEHLVVDVKESLERQIAGVDQRLDQRMREGFAEVKTRFDNQGARLDRHAALWQSGSRWSAGMDSWAEKVDTALEKKDREIADLRERLKQLENGSKNPPAA